MKRVAITGMGIVAPGGNSPDAFFDALIAGRSAIRRFPSDFAPQLSTRIAAHLDFDPTIHFDPPRLRMLDRVSQLALVAAKQAICAAKLELNDVQRARAGVFVGTGMGGGTSIEDGYATLFRDKSERIKPFTVLLAMNNAAAAWIASKYQLCGPCLTYSTACSSSAVAIGEAWRRIRYGDAEVMLAGGSEAALTLGNMKAWEALRTLASEDRDDPAASCKPFAKDRSGLVLGEGAAMFVLEEWEHACRRGATIEAELIGYGLSTDCGHITRPSVDGQANAMRLALASATLEPCEIGYLNAHGTATQANDATETAAIRDVFGRAAEQLPISSSKSMHAHLLGAAAAIELVACVKAMQSGIAPPTLNLHQCDPACDLDYVPNQARRGLKIHRAMSNSFAFGGTNAVLVISRHPAS